MKHPVTLLPALLLAALAPLASYAQGIGIGTTAPNASAALDIVSTSKGVLLPRVSSTGSVSSPATGLIVYQTGSPAGYYYNAGTAAAPSWQQLATASGAAVTATNGLTKTGSAIGLGGTLSGDTSLGLGAFDLALTGTGSVGIGLAAPNYPLDVAGVANVGTGLRVGGNAVAFYYGGNLYLGTLNLPTAAPSGPQNTFVGTSAGQLLTSGINNAVLGFIAGDALTSGSSNALLGVQAGGSLSTGNDNVFVGHDPGLGTVSGSRNVGIGYNALSGATAANDNVAIGYNALYSATANDNVAVGNAAGTNLTTGTFNTLLGSGANLNGSTQRSRATALGYNARVDQDDAVVLGDPTNVAVRTGLGTTTPAAKLDVQGGADSDGSNDPAALAFSWRSGGFRHFVRSRHNGTVTGAGNALDFYLNSSAGGAGSSTPGTGNVQVLTLESNNGLPRVGIGTTAPAVRLHVAGTAGTPNTRLESLGGTGTRVVTADASGNLATSATATTALESLLRLQKGTATVGPGGAGATVQVTITFPTAFATVPTVTATPRNQDGTSYGDTFTATIRSVSTTQCVVNVRRMDSGDAWSQNLLLSWLAIP